MKIETSFLRSKVAKRIFLLFVACALLPITALSIITYLNMGNQLREQCQRELIQASKSMGMAIFERLLLVDAEMRMISSNLIGNDNPSLSERQNISSLSKRFSGLSILTETGEIQNLFGNIHDISAISNEMRQRKLSYSTQVLVQYIPENQSRVYTAFRIKTEESRTRYLIAEINPSYLWLFGYDDSLPSGVELRIIDKSKNVLFSSHPGGDNLSNIINDKTQNKAMGVFDWESAEGKYMAGFRSILLMGQFDSPDWMLIVSKSKAVVFAPLSNFRLTFPSLILTTFWVVLLLSFNQIRRSMGPLVKLKEGTKRIAKKEFDSRIEISSRDEFEDVAVSFNSMAGQLGRQFKTLTAMVEIDRVCLAAQDEEKIVATVLEQLKDVFHCQTVGVIQLETDSNQSVLTFIQGDSPSPEKHTEVVELSDLELEMLRDNPLIRVTKRDDSIPRYISSMTNARTKPFIILPLTRNNRITGVITLGYEEDPELNQEDISQARHLADQVAVALSNAQLIEELNLFNLGTLRALARTIDAKSKWTAGHSERVTQIALQIGAAIGLTTDELNVLHRGGLLHDIGKLGVAHDILDKPGKLSDEEREMMSQHVLLGANILKPIKAYKNIIPIVKEHHENYDGTGYYEGLSGDNIDFYARITAVADRYEAMTADRPYRKAMDQEKAIRIIREQAGKQLDPEVVKAFLKTVKWPNHKKDSVKLREGYESTINQT